MDKLLFCPVKQSEPIPLKMGETYENSKFGCCSRYLEKDGRPWLPVMAEFHPTRFDYNDWELELRKIKAADIDIASTYLFFMRKKREFFVLTITVI